MHILTDHCECLSQATCWSVDLELPKPIKTDHEEMSVSAKSNYLRVATNRYPSINSDKSGPWTTNYVSCNGCSDGYFRIFEKLSNGDQILNIDGTSNSVILDCESCAHLCSSRGECGAYTCEPSKVADIQTCKLFFARGSMLQGSESDHRTSTCVKIDCPDFETGVALIGPSPTSAIVVESASGCSLICRNSETCVFFTYRHHDGMCETYSHGRAAGAESGT